MLQRRIPKIVGMKVGQRFHVELQHELAKGRAVRIMYANRRSSDAAQTVSGALEPTTVAAREAPGPALSFNEVLK